MKPSQYVLVITLIALLLSPLFLVPATPVSAAGSLSLDRYAAPAGAQIAVHGNGFIGSSSYIIRFGTGTSYNRTVAMGIVQADGSFVAYFVVPDFPGGAYTLLLATDVAANTASAIFVIAPVISVSRSSGEVGTGLTVTGSGFTAAGSARVYFDGREIGTAYTDARGVLSAEVTVPEAPRGNHAVKVQDSSGYSPSMVFTVMPSVTVTPADVAAGGRIAVTGQGFTSSSPVSFALDDVTLTGGAVTDSMGTFYAAALTIPAVPAGNHTLKVTDGSGTSLARDLTTLTSITAEPPGGPAGTIITVTGAGFKAGRTIALTFNGSALNTSPPVITTDAEGKFTAIVAAPGVPAGNGLIVAGDGDAAASAGFVSSASVSSGVTEGEVGSSVPVSGSGFNAGAGLVIRFDNVQIATATAGSSGSFSTSVIIPASRSGVSNILVTDGLNSGVLSFNVTPGVLLTPNSGNVGTGVTVKGYSFKPGGTVAVKYDTAQMAVVSADLNGTFSTSFEVPPGTGGDHLITLTDGEFMMTSIFTLESDPPPVPVPVSPGNAAGTGSRAEFQWQPVSDPSGVTYSLQIAEDAGFNNILIDKSGLESTGYVLSAAEKLAPAGAGQPYYWRIRAVDRASNAGDWSDPQSFSVGFPAPAWRWYLVIAAAAVVIFVLGYFLGRRLRG